LGAIRRAAKRRLAVRTNGQTDTAKRAHCANEASVCAIRHFVRPAAMAVRLLHHTQNLFRNQAVTGMPVLRSRAPGASDATVITANKSLETVPMFDILHKSAAMNHLALVVVVLTLWYIRQWRGR